MAGLVLCLVFASVGSALAQMAHHPFAVGANEGAVGTQNSFGAWILSQESGFYRGLTGAVREVKAGNGFALLIGLSFAYGVFHAAGPGHGKTVITSYMVANEVALRRGFAIALAAALLQGIVASAIVGVAALVFNATATRMTQVAQIAEFASYLGIIALGLLLVWRKGRALVLALRPATAPSWAMAPAAAAPTTWQGQTPSGRFFADDGYGHAPGCDCEAHMPRPEVLQAPNFRWKEAVGAILTAGARPCSGAILILVFSLSQGLFVVGVAATFAMALGTALTTGLLASVAVFAKDAALRLVGGTGHGTIIIGRLVEFAAGACVLAFGIILLAAAVSGPATGA